MLQELLQGSGFFDAPSPAVEIIDNRRHETRLRDAYEAALRRRKRIIDVEPVAVIELGTRPLVRGRAKPNPRRRRSRR